MVVFFPGWRGTDPSQIRTRRQFAARRLFHGVARGREGFAPCNTNDQRMNATSFTREPPVDAWDGSAVAPRGAARPARAGAPRGGRGFRTDSRHTRGTQPSLYTPALKYGLSRSLWGGGAPKSTLSTAYRILSASPLRPPSDVVRLRAHCRSNGATTVSSRFSLLKLLVARVSSMGCGHLYMSS